MIIPNGLIVVNHSSAKAPGRVNASASDRNCGQMNYEHSKSNGQGSQNLNHTTLVTSLILSNLRFIVYHNIYSTHWNKGIAGFPFRIGSGEDGVDKDESADDLCSQCGAF